MEKLSRIVPASSRFKSPDMSKERPVRSGAPNFGQPTAQPTIRQGIGTTVDNVKETYGRVFGPEGEKARERDGVRIVRETTAKFFNQPLIDPLSDELPEDSVEISTPESRVPQKEAAAISRLDDAEEEDFAPTAPELGRRALDVRA